MSFISNQHGRLGGKITTKTSPAGIRTPVSRVTGRDTYHCTTEDDLLKRSKKYVHVSKHGTTAIMATMPVRLSTLGLWCSTYRVGARVIS